MTECIGRKRSVAASVVRAGLMTLGLLLLTLAATGCGSEEADGQASSGLLGWGTCELRISDGRCPSDPNAVFPFYWPAYTADECWEAVRFLGEKCNINRGGRVSATWHSPPSPATRTWPDP